MIITTTNRMQPPAGTVLHVAGELDTFAADRLRDQLRQLGTPPSDAVVVDLSGVTFMSCTALSVLVEARARLGTRLYVSGRSRVVTRLLAMTGQAAHFRDLEDDDPALARAGELDKPPSASAAVAALALLMGPPDMDDSGSEASATTGEGSRGAARLTST